jgi:LAO/AO transport system kinase
MTSSASTGAGIRELWDCVVEYVALTKTNGWFARARRAQQKQWLHEMIEHALRQRFETHPAVRHSIEALERDVVEGRTTSFRAARMLLEMYSRPAAE